MTDSQRWLIFCAVVGGVVLVYLLSPILSPFIISALLAYLGDPIVDYLEKYRVPRSAAVAIVFALILVAMMIVPFVVVPLLEQQVTVLLIKLPGYIDWLQQNASVWLSEQLGVNENTLELGQLKNVVIDNWQNAGGFVQSIWASVSKSGLAMLGWIANLVLIPVVTFYLLRDWDILIAKIHAILPRRIEPAVVLLAKRSNTVLGAFLKGQIVVMLALSVIYSIGLSIIGLDLALLIGSLAGLVSFVPYLGFIIGILVAGIAVFLQYHEFLPMVWVVLVFGVGQMLEGMLLTPLLVGDKIGLHPVVVIFSVLAGGQLFGFLGVLLALPTAAIIMVLLRYVHERYMNSKLYAKPKLDV